jgi:hypothetical protein
VGIRHADHVAPFIRKSCQSLLRQAAVGVVRSRTQAMEFSLVYISRGCLANNNDDILFRFKFGTLEYISGVMCPIGIACAVAVIV